MFKTDKGNCFRSTPNNDAALENYGSSSVPWLPPTAHCSSLLGAAGFAGWKDNGFVKFEESYLSNFELNGGYEWIYKCQMLLVLYNL